MPDQIEKSGDYYYAYHLCADNRDNDRYDGVDRNFSVCYSKSRMCPVWVAAPMHSGYKGSSGRNEAYKDDSSIPVTEAGKWSGYTRGHMLGSSDRTASVSINKQVFYYSNIAPQLSSGFNTGGGVWNNLEDFTDGHICADTLYQVIGCHWANDDTKVTPSVGEGVTTIPTHFYKLLLRTKSGNSGKSVAECSASELKCAAFVVEHNSSQHMQEPTASMMISVAELEAMTGLRFFSNVPNAPKEVCNGSDWGL